MTVHEIQCWMRMNRGPLANRSRPHTRRSKKGNCIFNDKLNTMGILVWAGSQTFVNCNGEREYIGEIKWKNVFSKDKNCC